LRRAAAAAAMRRERNSSCNSEELQLKRMRPDSGMLGPNIINNNSLDIINHMPQITATDFSTNLKHMNNISPHIKDTDRMDVKTPNGESCCSSSRADWLTLFSFCRQQQQHAGHQQQQPEQQQQQPEGDD
jgi:hypothetical protein